MQIFKVSFWAALAVSVFLGGGCAEFRELFSTPPSGKSSQKKSAKKKKKTSEYQSRRYNRDPLDALIFRDRAQGEDWSKNSNLSDAEKRALKNSLDPDDISTRREIDRIYYENEKKRQKRKESVWGISSSGK